MEFFNLAFQLFGGLVLFSYVVSLLWTLISARLTHRRHSVIAITVAMVLIMFCLQGFLFLDRLYLSKLDMYAQWGVPNIQLFKNCYWALMGGSYAACLYSSLLLWAPQKLASTRAQIAGFIVFSVLLLVSAKLLLPLFMYGYADLLLGIFMPIVVLRVIFLILLAVLVMSAVNLKVEAIPQIK